MTLKDTTKKNVKKTAVGGIALSSPFIAYFLFNLNATVAQHETKIEATTAQVEVLKKAPEQIARVEEKVSGVKEEFVDFRGEQRAVNTKHENKLDKILEILMK